MSRQIRSPFPYGNRPLCFYTNRKAAAMDCSGSKPLPTAHLPWKSPSQPRRTTTAGFCVGTKPIVVNEQAPPHRPPWPMCLYDKLLLTADNSHQVGRENNIVKVHAATNRRQQTTVNGKQTTVNGQQTTAKTAPTITYSGKTTPTSTPSTTIFLLLLHVLCSNPAI